MASPVRIGFFIGSLFKELIFFIQPLSTAPTFYAALSFILQYRFASYPFVFYYLFTQETQSRYPFSIYFIFYVVFGGSFNNLNQSYAASYWKMKKFFPYTAIKINDKTVYPTGQTAIGFIKLCFKLEYIV